MNLTGITDCEEVYEKHFIDSLALVKAVDMSKINKDHPLYEMLERSNGIYNPFSMSEFLEELYNEIFVNADKIQKV